MIHGVATGSRPVANAAIGVPSAETGGSDKSGLTCGCAGKRDGVANTRVLLETPYRTGAGAGRAAPVSGITRMTKEPHWPVSRGSWRCGRGQQDLGACLFSSPRRRALARPWRGRRCRAIGARDAGRHGAVRSRDPPARAAWVAWSASPRAAPLRRARGPAAWVVTICTRRDGAPLGRHCVLRGQPAPSRRSVRGDRPEVVAAQKRGPSPGPGRGHRRGGDRAWKCSVGKPSAPAPLRRVTCAGGITVSGLTGLRCGAPPAPAMGRVRRNPGGAAPRVFSTTSRRAATRPGPRFSPVTIPAPPPRRQGLDRPVPRARQGAAARRTTAPLSVRRARRATGAAKARRPDRPGRASCACRCRAPCGRHRPRWRRLGVVLVGVILVGVLHRVEVARDRRIPADIRPHRARVHGTVSDVTSPRTDAPATRAGMPGCRGGRGGRGPLRQRLVAPASGEPADGRE